MRLSYSRVSLWERCRWAWRCRYILNAKRAPSWPLAFGSALHDVLEQVYRRHIEEEVTGRLDEAYAEVCWQDAWRRWCAPLGGKSGAWQEGWTWIHRAITAGKVDPWNVIGVELPVKFQAGDHEVIGYLDRLDRVDDTTLRVIDYKSNRILFTPWEVEDDLQVTVYDIAVRKMYPRARNVEFVFEMLAHGEQISTSRTEEQRQAAITYLATAGDDMEAATEFPASLNEYCSSCEYRGSCPEYRHALLEGEFPPEADPKDLSEAAALYERLLLVEKAATAKRKEIEKRISGALKEESELKLSGSTYRIYQVPSYEHSPLQVSQQLANVLGMTPFEAVEAVCAVDKKKLGKLLSRIEDVSKREVLKARFESKAKKRYFPRLWRKAPKR